MSRKYLTLFITVFALSCLVAVAVSAGGKRAPPRPKTSSSTRPTDSKGTAIPNSSNLTQRFSAWMKTFRIKERASAIFETFRRNVAFVMDANRRALASGRPAPILSANGPHTGMTLQEFARKRLGLVARGGRSRSNPPPTPTKSPKRSLSDLQAKDTVDWRRSMSSVVDQKSCGSCWAFAAAALIEGATAVKNGKSSLKLSEQHLVDCSQAKGCNGGYYGSTLSWVAKNGGVASSRDYPYKASVGKCNSGAAKSATVVKPIYISSNAEAMSVHVASKGPIAVSVDALNKNWQMYSRGVITAADCGKTTNHAVNIVGFTTIKNVPVWIIRNSWGAWWGMGGYAYLERGSGNACGVNRLPVGAQV